MIKKGYKTILGIAIVTFMLADDLIVPMAAEENVFVSDEAVAGSEIEAVDFVQPDGEDIQVVCDEEEYDGDLEDECEFSTMIEEADPTGFDELVDQVGAEDVPWLAEEKGENSVYSVSSDAIGDDRTYYGYIPITDLPIHHDVKPSEDMALGSDVDLSSYESPYWGNVIKDQGFTGNCWAFSTSTALEAGLRKKNVNDPSISWKNMSYWACRKSDLTGEDASDYFKYEYSASTYQSGMHNCINDKSDYQKNYYGRKNNYKPIPHRIVLNKCINRYYGCSKKHYHRGDQFGIPFLDFFQFGYFRIFYAIDFFCIVNHMIFSGFPTALITKFPFSG